MLFNIARLMITALPDLSISFSLCRNKDNNTSNNRLPVKKLNLGVKNPDLLVASSSSVICRKRANEGISGFEGGCNSPPRKITYFYVLESESDISSGEATESIHSIQDKSTDFAKDTSDTSTSSDDSNFSEYEVMSLDDDEQKNPFDLNDTLSSGTDTDIIRAVAISALCNDGDNLDIWADSSSVSSESDEPDLELSPADFWTCVQCKNTNNTPLYRYCEKCFKVRKNFFPPRPQGKKKRKVRPKKKVQATITFDSGIGSALDVQKSLECQERLSQPSTSGEQKCPDLRTDFVSLPSQSGENMSQPSQPSLSNEQKHPGNPFYQEPPCSTCFKNTKNGVFVHGSWAHIYSCYMCSMKIWKDTGRCPICNSKVSQVLKAVVAY